MGDKPPVAVNVDTKGIGEFAKPADRAVRAVAKTGEYLARFLAPVEHAIGIVADRLLYAKWERQQRLGLRAQEFMAAKGLKEPTRKLPFSVGVPLLAAAALEENDEMQDVWARLLVNGADARETEIKRAYVSILENLTPVEARLLESVYNAPPELLGESLWAGSLPEQVLPESVRERLPKEAQEQLPELSQTNHEALWNLIRLGCLAHETAWKGNAATWVSITPLGVAFVKACTLRPMGES